MRPKTLFSHFLKEEEKAKLVAKSAQHFPAPIELSKKWLRQFLWLPKETRLFWQRQFFCRNDNDFMPKSYHWVSVSHMQQELDWPIYKHMFRPAVYGRKLKKYQEKWRLRRRHHTRRTAQAPQALKKPWSKWKKKDSTFQPKNQRVTQNVAAKAKMQEKKPKGTSRVEFGSKNKIKRSVLSEKGKQRHSTW